MRYPRLVVITGTSGAGKSTALKTFEDLGFFCVDNLPLFLLPKFLELASRSHVERIALVIDIREKRLKQVQSYFQEIKEKGYQLEVIFLDASDEVIIRRFKETRRRHPLAEDGKGIAECIKEERHLLSEIQKLADEIVDTSSFSVHELKRWIEKRYKQEAIRRFHIQVISFGFKYGLPYEADLVFDVRFLANPYFVNELRPLSGQNQAIKKFVTQDEKFTIFLDKISNLLCFLIPLYKEEGKNFLNIAIGCTGGKHRSVVVAEVLTQKLKQFFAGSQEYDFSLTHRDIMR